MTAAIAFDLFLDEYQAEIDQKENAITFPMGYIVTEIDFNHWTNSKKGLAVVRGGNGFSEIKIGKYKGFKNENPENEIENSQIKTVKIEGSYLQNQNFQNQNLLFVKFNENRYNKNENLEREMTKAYMKLLS